MNHVLFARQPIFDRQLDIIGYELLFRKDDDDVANFFDGDHATARVVVNAFTETGANDILGGKPAFINLTENLIRSGIIQTLPKERAVLEILEDVRVNDDIISDVTELVNAGFKIALDDFVWTPKMRPLVKLAHYIKLDIMALTPTEVTRNLAILHPYKAKLVAEKVETQAALDLCMEQGFDFFQGYFLARPHKVSGRSVPASRASMLHLLSRIYPIGSALDCVVAHEQCRWGDVTYASLDAATIQTAYLEAIAWASETKKTGDA